MTRTMSEWESLDLTQFGVTKLATARMALPAQRPVIAMCGSGMVSNLVRLPHPYRGWALTRVNFYIQNIHNRKEQYGSQCITNFTFCAFSSAILSDTVPMKMS